MPDARSEALIALEHLRTGNHLPPAQSAVVEATLDDALMDIGTAFRV